MNLSDVLTIVGAAALTLFMGWYFFGPKRSHRASMENGVQVVRVTVRGGYQPEVVEVSVGTPVRLLFDREETGDCSSRVVIPDFRVNQALRRLRPPRSCSPRLGAAPSSSRAA